MEEHQNDPAAKLVERRSRPSILETLSYHKEIPTKWLLTFLAGGLANFTVIVWLAATFVSETRANGKDIETIKLLEAAKTDLLAAHSAELKRLAEVDNSVNERVSNIEKTMRDLDTRLFDLKKGRE